MGQRRPTQGIIPINKILAMTNPNVVFVIGRRDNKSMPHRDGKGRVKVYRDRDRCWKEGKASLPKHLDLDVFGMDQANWDRFKEEVPYVEVEPDASKPEEAEGGGAVPAPPDA